MKVAEIMIYIYSQIILNCDLCLIFSLFVLSQKSGIVFKSLKVISFFLIFCSLLIGLIVQIYTPYFFPFLAKIVLTGFNEGISFFLFLSVLMVSCSFCLLLISVIYFALFLHIIDKVSWAQTFFKFYTTLYFITIFGVLMLLQNLDSRINFKILFEFTNRRLEISTLSLDNAILIWLEYTSHLSAILYFIFIMQISFYKSNTMINTQLNFEKKIYFHLFIFFIYYLINVIVKLVYYQ